MKEPTITELVALARAAAAEAADFQERYAAEDTEARKIVDIMESFLRIKGRVVYGGAAINAHLSPEHKFYDPTLYLPDYDFMTPDPLQDCADLIVQFQQEGFIDVEAKFGIHEGTYKIFVNYRPAADITYMPPEIYERIIKDASTIEGIHYASPNFLRMNMYLELSRPAGMVSRWEKVYERLLLLNEEHPIKAGNCPVHMYDREDIPQSVSSRRAGRQRRIIEAGIETGSVFLTGISFMFGTNPPDDEVVMMISNSPTTVTHAITEKTTLIPITYPAQGELLPARTELRTKKGELDAVIFETVACHSYITLQEPADYRLASLDLLIQMYYAMYFAQLDGYVPYRLLCVIQMLVDMESERRKEAAIKGAAVKPHEAFTLECIGHQPSMPELKKAHRERVIEKRKELENALRVSSGFRVTRRRPKEKVKVKAKTV